MKKFIIALLLSSSLLIAYSVGVYNRSGHEIAAFGCQGGKCPFNSTSGGAENGTFDIIKNGACSNDYGGACQFYTTTIGTNGNDTSLGIQVTDANAPNKGCVYYATFDTISDGNYIIYGGPHGGGGEWANNGKVYKAEPSPSGFPAFDTSTSNSIGTAGFQKVTTTTGSFDVSSANIIGDDVGLAKITNVPIITGPSCNLK